MVSCLAAAPTLCPRAEPLARRPHALERHRTHAFSAWPFQHSSHENLSPQVIMRVGREIQQLAKKPLDGIKYIPIDEDSIGEIHAEIAGPGIFGPNPAPRSAPADALSPLRSWDALRGWSLQDETSSD